MMAPDPLVKDTTADPAPVDVSYVLPILASRAPDPEFTAYLRFIASRCQLIVVDGSPAPVFEKAHSAWSSFAQHLAPDPDLDFRNGKVNGVLTGLRRAHHDHVVIADDDVRYTPDSLYATVAGLRVADLVRPQNHFTDLPWWARWDTARSLVNRAVGADFPGTLAVRRQVLLDAGGYDGDVLFENLELIRTVSAAGGTVVTPLDLYVPRLPAERRHFLQQRVRQAYEELARPLSFGVSAAIIPLVLVAGHRRRWVMAILAVGSMALAERGRRRAGGATVFPVSSVAFAPLWLAERSITCWLALGRRARGGCLYSHGRILRAANRPAQIRRRLQGPSAPSLDTAVWG